MTCRKGVREVKSLVLGVGEKRKVRKFETGDHVMGAGLDRGGKRGGLQKKREELSLGQQMQGAWMREGF